MVYEEEDFTCLAHILMMRRTRPLQRSASSAPTNQTLRTWLPGPIAVSEQIRNGPRYIAESNTTNSATEELEDEEHW